jgi:putative DNA primase/helicase
VNGTDQIAAAASAAAAAEPLPPDDGALAEEPRNDIGNARRLIARHGHDLIHVDESGWHVWTGRQWQGQPAKAAPDALLRAQATAEAIEREARSLHPPLLEAEGELHRLERQEPRDVPAVLRARERVEDARQRVSSHRKFGVASGNSGRLKSMLEVAAPMLRRRPDQLDADAYLLNVANGTLVLGRSEGDADGIRLRPHDRADLITKLAPVAYDPAAECPTFRQFLAEAQPEDELRLFLQVWTGYCATGDTREQRIVLNHGGGANGKSTFLGAIADALGDYAVPVPIETFLQDERRRSGEATPDIVRLIGARLALASEPERGAKLSEAVVKRVTGGEKMTARKLYEGMFDFDPEFKLVLSANEKPRITGQDEGIWRRVMLVPWKAHFSEERRKGEFGMALKANLKAELPGILNWILDGVRLWLERGLVVPDQIKAATEQYRLESDPIGEWWREFVREKPGSQVQASRLYGGYVRWAKLNGMHPASLTAWGRRLSDMGAQKDRWGGIVSYFGVELDQDSLDALEAATVLRRPDEAPPPRSEADYGAQPS